MNSNQNYYGDTTTYTIQLDKKKTYKWDIVWINVIILGLLHLAAVYAIIIRSGVMVQTIIFGKFLATLTTFGITAGAHRLWSHRSYKANTMVQIILAVMMTLTYQNSILHWCRDHRLHHKHSETDADPHNAKRGFFFSHVGWLLIRKHPAVIEQGKLVDIQDLRNNSIVMFQHKYYFVLVILWAFVIPIYVPMYFWGENFKFSFFLTILRWVIQTNLTWCINSLAHLYGNKPYNKNIGPVQNSFMLITSLGEGYHNYHHTYPMDYKTSEFRSDVCNSTSMLIDMFAKLGWVTDRITISQSVIDARIEKTGDKSYVPSVSQLKSIILLVAFFYLI